MSDFSKAKIFLNKMYEKVYGGYFDSDINIPFMSRKLIYTSIKSKIDKKLETGANPLLSEKEIKECINEAKETAVFTSYVFLKTGIIEKTKDGYELSSITRKVLSID